eukprot:6867104-Prymnesium_polylepis.1
MPWAPGHRRQARPGASGRPSRWPPRRPARPPVAAPPRAPAVPRHRRRRLAPPVSQQRRRARARPRIPMADGRCCRQR